MSAQANAASRQGMLFGDPLEGLDTDEVGYRGPVACSAAGITYRQLDYWARTGLLQPSIRAARGSGSQRLYSFRDILVLKVVKKLLDAGVSLQQVRVAVSSLQNRGVDDLASLWAACGARSRARLRNCRLSVPSPCSSTSSLSVVGRSFPPPDTRLQRECGAQA